MVRVVLFGVADGERLRRALAIRKCVFMDEQNVPADEEIDEHDLTDAGAVHALALAAGDDIPIGTGRFFEAEPGCAQIGRMAVLRQHRGRGTGRVLLDALVGEARRRGYRRAQLFAQVHAVAFYERAGFISDADGMEIWDAGIPHRLMKRALA